MRLGLSVRRPSIERVVNDETLFQHLMIIWAKVTQAHGNSQQPRRLRREIMAVGVRTTNYGCNRDDGGISIETVFGYEGVKATAFTRVGELNSRHVVGDGTGLCSDAGNLIWWHKEKLGLRVDKPSDEPRTSNPVNHRPFSSNPFHGTASSRKEIVVGLPCGEPRCFT